MADISISKYRVQIPRDGAIPATPGFVVSEGQDPINPPGSPTGIYVPYLGATNNVDLGEYSLSTGNLVFDTTPTNIPTAQGSMYWDATDETVALVMNGAIQKVGEDSFYQVKNQTGSNIAKGVAVRFAGTVGNSGRLLIAPFLADGTYPSTYFMGVTMEAIPNGEDGKVMWFGRIRGINTNAYNEGDILYASTTVAGGFQTAVPQAPNNIVEICAVVTKSTTVGTIFVRPTLGSNINRDEGVKITSPATGDLLQRQSNGLFENRSLASIGLITGSGNTNYLAKFTSNGSTIGNSAVFESSGNVGIGTNNPTAALNVSGINIGAAIDWTNTTSSTGRSFRWVSLNSGGFAIEDLTAGGAERMRIFSSGNVNIGSYPSDNGSTLRVNGTGWIDGTLSIRSSATASTPTHIPVFIADPSSTTRTLVTRTPTQLLGDLGGVPTSRTLTINGTSFDLSANRSWTIPTHDAVTIGTANGLSLSGQILSLGLASSTTNGALSSTDWTTFNNKQTQLNGTGFVKVSGTTISYDNSSYYLASNPAGYTTNTGTVTSIGLSSSTSGVTIGSTPITTSGTITLSIATASSSQQGLLSSSDWNTFNNKQNALTNPVTGTGNTNYLAKFTSNGSTIGNSAVFESSGNVGIGTPSPVARLDVQANAGVDGYALASYAFLKWSSGDILDYGAFGNTWQALRFFTNNTERMRIFSGGNVHIGGTPSSDNGARLQVSGDVRIQPVGVNTNPFVIRSSIINNNILTINQDSSGNGSLFVLNSSGSNNVQIRSNGDTYFSGGDFIIGNTTSSDKLRVEGITYTNKIITELPNTITRGVEWKLGEARTDTIPNANRLIRVEIDGVQYDILCRQVI